MSYPDGELHCIVNEQQSQLASGQKEILQKLQEFDEEKRKNGETSQKCDQLVLYAPLKFLSSSENEDIKLVLSDTPGFGEAGVDKITDTVTVAVKELCGFILILNSDYMKSESELSLLRKLEQYHPELFSEFNRMLILVNGHENLYRAKNLSSKSASVTPEDVPLYISDYLNKPGFLDTQIPPEKIILFNALWALRSREWRSTSILEEGRKEAKTLFTDALQMLRYIGLEEKADELERDMSEANINTTLSLLEPFSKIEHIESLLHKMVVENGGTGIAGECSR